MFDYSECKFKCRVLYHTSIIYGHALSSHTSHFIHHITSYITSYHSTMHLQYLPSNACCNRSSLMRADTFLCSESDKCTCSLTCICMYGCKNVYTSLSGIVQLNCVNLSVYINNNHHHNYNHHHRHQQQQQHMTLLESLLEVYHKDRRSKQVIAA